MVNATALSWLHAWLRRGQIGSLLCGVRTDIVISGHASTHTEHEITTYHVCKHLLAICNDLIHPQGAASKITINSIHRQQR